MKRSRQLEQGRRREEPHLGGWPSFHAFPAKEWYAPRETELGYRHAESVARAG